MILIPLQLSELEQRVVEAETRAEDAEDKVRLLWMIYKLSNSGNYYAKKIFKQCYKRSRPFYILNNYAQE